MDTRADHTYAPIVVSVHADEVTDNDMPHYLATLQRALRFVHSENTSRVEVFINPRGVYASQPEWLEHCIRVHNVTGGCLTIGAIQRTIGADSEFCS